MNPNDTDAYNVFGVNKPYTPGEESWHREMARRSLDIIRVKNPDTFDFYVEWDKRHWRVPANDTADLQRYLAVKYCRDKFVDIVNKLSKKMHDEAIKEREKQGLPSYRDKYTENWETYMTGSFPTTSDDALRSKIYQELWLGLVVEFGKDNPPPTQYNSKEGETDLTPIEQKILMTLENKKVSINTKPFTESQPIKQPTSPVFVKEPINKESLIKEVTVEDDNKR